MSLEEKFQEAAKAVRKLSKRPSNEELLEIYGYFKQATVGDCQSDRPSSIYVEAGQKWDAWNARKGMDSSTAKEEYIRRANELQAIYM